MIDTLKRIESSMVYAAGYNEKGKVMEVVFCKGSIWRYYDVPKEVYEGLLRAGSAGSYMRASVIGCYEDEPL